MGKTAAQKDEEGAEGEAKAASEPEEGKVQVLDPEVAAEIAKYDLTAKMTPFLDVHLLFPIVLFAQESGVYKAEGVIQAEFQLLEQTNMIDFAIEKYEALGMEVPSSLQTRRESVMEQFQATREKVLKLLEMLENEDQVKKIPGFQTLEDLCTDFDIDISSIDDLVHFAKFQYECGNYQISREVLKHYRNMPQSATSAEAITPKHVSCIWGALASALLLRDNEEATELIFKLDEHLENTKVPKREVLLHRTWLLHWALPAIFSRDKVEHKLLDFFLNEKSLSIISLSCPHLFRYVGAILILQKRLKHLVKDTVQIINLESSSYSDPVTRFLLALYIEMDYDDAQRGLQKCEQVCKGDFFLNAHWAEFQENARLHVFESYCRIHQCINISMIATKLNMQPEEAELWIVKLIQSAKLDARIDSEKSRVVMTKAPPNVYQQVIEKTKNLAFRSTMLVSNLEKA